MVDYIPSQKDIVYVNFNPQSGHEQMGTRPAVVLSNKGFNTFTKLALVCPITSSLKNFPLHIKLKDYQKIKGVVMVEQLKTIDYNSRNIKFVEKIDDDTYYEIINILKSFIDIE
jgi:mRNA interferase MazF